MTQRAPTFGTSIAGLVLLSLIIAACSTPRIGGPVAPRNDPKAGVLTLPGGREVFVYPYELSYTGSASYRWPDGRMYAGDLVNGLPQGNGEDFLPNGEHYSGDWHLGMRQGKGILILSDKSRYEGAFHENLRSGAGTLKGTKGSYQGDWLKDRPEGQGLFNYNDGSLYRGHWSKGRRNGYGYYERPDGSAYEGDWSNDIPHGFGKVSETSGVTYDGQWVMGKRQGYGTAETNAQVNYEGMWFDNKRKGYGREVRPDGTVYLGEWLDDQRQGHGIGTRADGTRHVGYWEEDVPSGPGTRSNAIGIVISGLWQGSYVTSGILTLPGGEQYTGELYRENNRVVAEPLLAWLKQMANNGNAYAELLLGVAYSQYQQPNRDLNEATRWLSAAATKGISEAEYLLGEIFLQGDNTQGRGLELLLQAAAQNHVGANLRIGTLYQLGEYLPKNHALACNYYRAASQRGNVVARNNLAWLLATSPDETVRNGTRAVELARPIAFLFNSWGYIDTLAAALAEKGNWQQAIEMQQRAIDSVQSDSANATLKQQLQQMRDRIKLFQSERPFREP